MNELGDILYVSVYYWGAVQVDPSNSKKVLVMSMKSTDMKRRRHVKPCCDSRESGEPLTPGIENASGRGCG